MLAASMFPSLCVCVCVCVVGVVVVSSVIKERQADKRNCSGKKVLFRRNDNDIERSNT